MADIVDRFAALWQGREGVYGEVWGECVERTLTKADWESHLFDGGSVGIYPLVPNATGECVVHWGATDIGLGFDMLVLAKNVQTALTALGISAFIEKSKGKGYHVIAHVGEWIPAEWMRNTFLVAHQLAGVKATEVYPK